MSSICLRAQIGLKYARPVQLVRPADLSRRRIAKRRSRRPTPAPVKTYQQSAPGLWTSVVAADAPLFFGLSSCRPGRDKCGSPLPDAADSRRCIATPTLSSVIQLLRPRMQANREKCWHTKANMEDNYS